MSMMTETASVCHWQGQPTVRPERANNKTNIGGDARLVKLGPPSLRGDEARGRDLKVFGGGGNDDGCGQIMSSARSQRRPRLENGTNRG